MKKRPENVPAAATNRARKPHKPPAEDGERISRGGHGDLTDVTSSRRPSHLKPDNDGGDTGSDTIAPSDEFVASEFQSRRDNKLGGVFVPHWALDVTEVGDERLVLAQLAYWFGSRKANGAPRAKVQRDGFYWVVKTHQELGAEVGLGARQIRYVVDKLREKGLIATAVHPFGGRPKMTYFRLRAGVIAKTPMRPRGKHHERAGADNELY